MISPASFLSFYVKFLDFISTNLNLPVSTALETCSEQKKTMLQTQVRVRLTEGIKVMTVGADGERTLSKLDKNRIVQTTVGRCVFFDMLPPGMPLYNYPLKKSRVSEIIADCHKLLGREATLILLDEGKFNLNDPVDPWLPELANRQVLLDPTDPLDSGRPASRPIRVIDLLTHRSGSDRTSQAAVIVGTAHGGRTTHTTGIGGPGIRSGVGPAAFIRWQDGSAILHQTFHPTVLWLRLGTNRWKDQLPDHQHTNCQHHGQQQAALHRHFSPRHVRKTFSGNRVETAPGEGMTATHTTNGQPAATQGAVLADGLHAITRTGGVEATGRREPGRDHRPITRDHAQGNALRHAGHRDLPCFRPRGPRCGRGLAVAAERTAFASAPVNSANGISATSALPCTTIS